MARGSQLYGDHGYYARMEEKFQTLAVPSTTATTPRDGNSASEEGEGAFVTAAAIANAAILPTALTSGNASGDEEADDYYAAIPLDTSEAVDVDESILQPAMRSRGQSRTQSRSQSPRGGGAAGSGGAPSAAEAKAVAQPKLPSKRIRSAPALSLIHI